jgi:hypothetical protein
MVWHTLQSAQGNRPTGSKNGVWVGVEEKVLSHGKGKSHVLYFILYQSAMLDLTWKERDKLVLMVGADKDSGQMALRLARDDEIGNMLRRTDTKRPALVFGRAMGDSWVLPRLPGRPAEPAANWRAENNELFISLRGDFTRVLREAQEAEQKKRGGR